MANWLSALAVEIYCDPFKTSISEVVCSTPILVSYEILNFPAAPFLVVTKITPDAPLEP